MTPALWALCLPQRSAIAFHQPFQTSSKEESRSFPSSQENPVLWGGIRMATSDIHPGRLRQNLKMMVCFRCFSSSNFRVYSQVPCFFPPLPEINFRCFRKKTSRQQNQEIHDSLIHWWCFPVVSCGKQALPTNFHIKASAPWVYEIVRSVDGMKSKCTWYFGIPRKMVT